MQTILTTIFFFQSWTLNCARALLKGINLKTRTHENQALPLLKV